MSSSPINHMHACHLCAKTYKTAKALQKHVADHRQCKYCGHMCTGSAAYEKHLLACVKHEEYECEVCGEPVKREFMAEHLRANEESHSKCELCDRFLYPCNDLIDHLEQCSQLREKSGHLYPLFAAMLDSITALKQKVDKLADQFDSRLGQSDEDQ